MSRYPVNIPEASVENFEIVKYQYNGTTDEFVGFIEPAGEYTHLLMDNASIMSDATREYRECQDFINAATGDVLIAGLGLGHVHQPLLDNPNVTSVTIIEKYQEVIDLVWDHFVKDDRFSVIKADIYTWTPTGTYDVAWFDSWIGENMNEGDEVYYSPSYESTMTSRYDSSCNQMFFWRSERTP